MQQLSPRLLAVAVLLTCLQQAACQNSSDAVFGKAYLTTEHYPLPDGYRIVNAGHQIHCGNRSISDRIAVEKTAYTVTDEIFRPLNAQLRYTTYSAHRSVTPGLGAYTCVIYDIQAYVLNGKSPELFSNANALYILSRQAEQRFLQLRGFPINVYLAQTYTVGTSNVTSVDTQDILSRIELSGRSLAPFSYDKQFLLTSSVFFSSRDPVLPVATVNMSSWSALRQQITEATGISPLRRRQRRLLQSNDTVTLEVWTSMIPPINDTAASTWKVLKKGIEERMAGAGIPATLTFRNATSYTRLKGATQAVVTQENQDGIVVPAQSSGSGGGGLAAGVIAAIVAVAVACAVALAVAAFAFVRLQQRRRKSKDKDVFQTPEVSGDFKLLGTNSSGASDPYSYAISTPTSGGGSIAIPPKDVMLCRNPDGSSWLLGAGNFGKVYKGLWRGHHEVAVKQLNCFADDQLLESLQKEIDIMKMVSFNRNVVQFYGFSLGGGDGSDLPDSKGSDAGPMLVMEFMEGGDLRRALWKQPAEFAWHKRGQHVAMDIARGMHFLHSSGVIHRDIKSSNVLLNRDGTAKLADVGLAITADYFSAGSATGTFSYASPELLMGGKCSPKVDVYSFGVVLWEIVTGQPPVRGHLREVQPDECPAEVNQLLVDCITVDVDQRPTAAEVLERLEAIVPPLSEPDG